ncbi:MAG: fatty acid desaturase [Bdellovibrionales bacterium]|nr:fatty acid desaturase [Bdellovibrionales bacterium]
MSKLKFSEDQVSRGFPEFRGEVFLGLGEIANGRFATRITKVKVFVLGIIIIFSYIFLLVFALDTNVQLISAFIFGISLLFFVLSISHDCAHGAFSKKRIVNILLLHVPFALLGIDPKMWQMRHLKSHHKFPNIDECDADIDENPFIRLSPNQDFKPWHRFQHLYALVLYTFVAIHAVWIQDLNYMNREKLANMNNWHKLVPSWTRFFAYKSIHVSCFYLLPIYFMQNSWAEIVLGSLFIQGVISLFFILPLIGTHFSDKAAFPTLKDGKIEYSYPHYQIVASIDWNPTSK